MQKLTPNILLTISGGASAWGCFALGFAAGASLMAGGPLGWAGAIVALGSAIDEGCFS
ncbi:MAG: hypothetical protein ACTSPQ_19650 [Candidatus Helarchaeota archaeon]